MTVASLQFWSPGVSFWSLLCQQDRSIFPFPATKDFFRLNPLFLHLPKVENAPAQIPELKGCLDLLKIVYHHGFSTSNLSFFSFSMFCALAVLHGSDCHSWIVTSPIALYLPFVNEPDYSADGHGIHYQRAFLKEDIFAVYSAALVENRIFFFFRSRCG